MLLKFETKSNRVKGVCFHPKRTWVLASLHNGVIQLWDYRMGTLVDRFEEHEGPVRSVEFHQTQPLFVSGGDDYKIKVWNYKLRRCMFSLLGHLDYVRTVQFHNELPWIISASDDQTIRLWNWQNRQCISVLTGHNHYVMCASFHPKDDLIVSASLDQTVRVWDISALRKKSMQKQDIMTSQPNPLGPDLFGGTDVLVKYVLEGHDRGVNWACFHPSSPLVVSGADDRTLKIWRMNESKAWEVDTLRGHINNVSCVLFHPKQELIISNSEDKTVRVWDMSKRVGVQTFRRENDRFWVMAVHQETSLLAAGHDSGLIVFKLERERPAYSVTSQAVCVYIKDRTVRRFEFATAKDIPLVSLRRPQNSGSTPGPVSNPITMSYMASENAALILYGGEQPSYELHILPKTAQSTDKIGDCKRGSGNAVVWVARNRFAVLDKTARQIVIKNLENEVTKKCTPPYAFCDAMFQAGTGVVLLRCEDKMVIFDIQQTKSMGETVVPHVKYVAWSPQNDYVAMLAKHVVVIADKTMKQLCTVHETIRVKSGVWNEFGVFIYSTLNHIKYCLPNGDSGIICTIENPVYLTAVIGESIFYLDREGRNCQLIHNSTEYVFKSALSLGQFDEVRRIMSSDRLCGQYIIGYLKKKGFPEIALHFVLDDLTRFNLALECGNLETAETAAATLDREDCYLKLSDVAIRQGRFETAEKLLHKCKNFERLTFLYLISGNIAKLRKMAKIAENRGEIERQFHCSIYSGDAADRVRSLVASGLAPLAYACALSHGLADVAVGIRERLEPDVADSVDASMANRNPKLMQPPIPLGQHGEWPMLMTSKGFFDQSKKPAVGLGIVDSEDVGTDGGAGWGDDELDLDLDGTGASRKSKPSGDAEVNADGEEGGEAGWDMEDLDIPDVPGVAANNWSGGSKGSGFYAPPSHGHSAASRWSSSSLIGEQCAAGSFEVAAQLLRQQIGVIHIKPFRSMFMACFMGAHASMSTTSPVPGLSLPLFRNPSVSNPQTGMPLLAFSLDSLKNHLKSAYQLTTAGKFIEAQAIFLEVLLSVPFLCLENKPQLSESKQLVVVCREYLQAMLLELTRKDLKDSDPVRSAELAAFFTHCNIDTTHLMLALRMAMTCAFKLKNRRTAGGFCRRLLEMNPSAQVAQQVQKVLQACDAQPDDEAAMNYDERNPFSLCCASLKPIYRGSPSIKCPFCASSFTPSFNGSLCTICKVSEVGADAVGMQLLS